MDILTIRSTTGHEIKTLKLNVGDSEKKHAKFSPSGAERWANCIASIIPAISEPQTSEKAEHGTQVHERIKTLLTRKQPGKNTINSMRTVRAKDPLTLEAIKYIDLLIEDIETYDVTWSEFNIETYIGDDTFGGTPDFYALLYEDGFGVIYDYKTGSMPVNPDSWQMAAYANLISQGLYLDLNANIIQDGFVKTHEFKCGNKQVKQVGEFAKINEANIDTYRAGDWCRYCSRLAECPLVAGLDFTDDIVSANGYKRTRLIKARINAYEQLVRQFAGKVPGLAIKEVRTRVLKPEAWFWFAKNAQSLMCTPPAKDWPDNLPDNLIEYKVSARIEVQDD